MMKNLKKKPAILGLLCISLILCAALARSQSVKADDSTTADLRLIFTTDIHGQLNSTDYETGTELSVGGLSRAYNVIKKARQENPNYLTFDVGDVIFDYTTEYIYAADQTVVQPIYLAMAEIGYDAVTLGNHEFDYDYDYVVSQLKSSGLFGKVIVSNLTDSKSGEHPFGENRIITKTLTTSSGKSMDVKVGVIGETLPILSSKGQDFAGVLKVQDIVENVTEQAAALKEQGADVIVVLSHSGMGVENPAYGDKNASYALTKIDDVDVVLCGHEHNPFPSEDQTGKYYKLSGVDKATNLVNGKNLVMAEDRGESVGVVDLTLTKDEDGVQIKNRKSELRKVTSKTADEETSIKGLYDDWSEQMLEFTRDKIGHVNADHLLHNFNGLVEDNPAIQLINDAKRAYALDYINKKAPDYVKYPVIAGSTYTSYGANSYDDYVNISGDLTESDLTSLQGYNGYTAIYKITGGQLREWLEWAASAYVTVNQKVAWKGGSMADYMQTSGLQSLVYSEWIDDWNSFYVFDGVEYTIDPTCAPRYNHAGIRINTTNRIMNLTYNGELVKADQEFILACGKLAKTTEANVGIDKQAIFKGYFRTQSIIKDYVEQRSKLGSLEIEPDYNWNIALPSSYKFITKTTSIGEKILTKSPWYIKTLGKSDDYIYSVGSFAGMDNRNKINLLVSATYREATSDKVKVAVVADSKSKVVEVKYAKGDLNLKSAGWISADKVTNNGFYADANGIYSVYAKDSDGNVSVVQVMIDNVYSGILKKPSVNTYTNRKSKITGTADPGSTVVIESGTNQYTTVTNTDGAFSYALPSQKSGTKLVLYAKNEKKNLLSDKVTVNVKRTGPNKPKLYGAANNSDQVKGNLNDDDAYPIAIVDQTVYVPDEKTKTLFQASELYKSSYKIEVTSMRVDSSYEFMLTVPVQDIGTKISIYSIDHISRVSVCNTVTVEDAAPNPPNICEITAADCKVEGYISSSTPKTIFTVYITVGKSNYTTTTDATGYFSLGVDPESLKVGTNISVYAKDTVNHFNRISFTVTTKVLDPENCITKDNDLFIQEINVKDTVINGWNDSQDEVTVSVKSKGSYTTYSITPDDSGDFTVYLNQPIKSGDVVYSHTTATNGSILDMVKTEVELVAPHRPYYDETITNADLTYEVYTDVESTMVLKVGKTSYESANATYNQEDGMYRFKFKIPQTKAGTKVVAYAYNAAGTSSKLSMVVEKAVPEAPSVDKVYTTSTKIKGKVDVIGETEVYAKVGSTNYMGTVKANGKYTIKIPKQKKNTNIKVWGGNENGTGFSTWTKVLKKAEKKAKAK